MVPERIRTRFESSVEALTRAGSVDELAQIVCVSTADLGAHMLILNAARERMKVLFPNLSEEDRVRKLDEAIGQIETIE